MNLEFQKVRFINFVNVKQSFVGYCILSNYLAIRLNIIFTGFLAGASEELAEAADLDLEAFCSRA